MMKKTETYSEGRMASVHNFGIDTFTDLITFFDVEKEKW